MDSWGIEARMGTGTDMLVFNSGKFPALGELGNGGDWSEPRNGSPVHSGDPNPMTGHCDGGNTGPRRGDSIPRGWKCFLIVENNQIQAASYGRRHTSTGNANPRITNVVNGNCKIPVYLPQLRLKALQL